MTEKACLGEQGCLNFCFDKLDRKCRAGHNPFVDEDGNEIDRHKWGIGCPDWESRTEKTIFNI
jgi:hypothetical protein